MLFEMAVADAYSAAFEFTSPQFVDKYHDMATYVVHETYNDPDTVRTEAGQYTDDTQMSIAIAELVCQNGIWNQFHTLNRILKVFKRDPRRGYSKRMFKALELSTDANCLMRFISPMATTNGACIRSVPLAFLPYDKIIPAAYAQASATHASKNGIESSCLVGLIGYELLHGSNIDDAIRVSCQKLEIKPLVPYKGMSVPCNGFITVRASVTLLQVCDNLYDILDGAVLMGGDTDSVAAVAVGLASLSALYENNLPESLMTGLEPNNNQYGIDFLKNLDSKLLKIV